jgi:glyoxylase I family protein
MSHPNPPESCTLAAEGAAVATSGPAKPCRRLAMPQPEGQQLEALRTHRAQLRETYLRETERPASTARGLHHLALIARDVEETIRFYQDLLGFPLVELVENRDYAGSSHFFFDIGNGNLLGFFDFPGHDHPEFSETIGNVQHIAISVSEAEFRAAKQRFDEAGLDYLGPDRGADNSLYVRDPNGTGIELYCEHIGVFEGEVLLPDAVDDAHSGLTN